MKLRSVYKIHRRIAILCGVLLLIQLISGAVMVLPRLGLRGQPVGSAPVDYSSITLSPAEALEMLTPHEQSGSRNAPVAAMKLQPLLGRIVYEVRFEGGATRLIDGESGHDVEITPEMGAEIARGAVDLTSPIREVERLERYDYRWRSGVLPVYRVSLADAGASVLYVNAANGSVVGRSARWDRIRSVIVSLHEFEPITWALGSNRIRKAALLLSALLGVVVVSSGYYLALARPRGGDEG